MPYSILYSYGIGLRCSSCGLLWVPLYDQLFAAYHDQFPWEITRLCDYDRIIFISESKGGSPRFFSELDTTPRAEMMQHFSPKHAMKHKDADLKKTQDPIMPPCGKQLQAQLSISAQDSQPWWSQGRSRAEPGGSCCCCCLECPMWDNAFRGNVSFGLMCMSAEF